MPSSKAPVRESTAATGLPEGWKSPVSILLAIHLACLSICMMSVLPTSDLGARLLSVFSPYLQLFHFDLDYTPYYQTRESLNNETLMIYSEREYFFEYLPEDAADESDESWERLDTLLGGVPSTATRLQRFASTTAFFAEEDTEVSRFTRDVALYLVSQKSLRPSKLRIRQHRPVPRERFYGGSDVERDPAAELFYTVPYTARIVYGADGTVDVMRDVPRAESALIQ